MHFKPFIRYVALARPYRLQIIIGVLMTLVGVVLTLPGPWILKLLIDSAIPNKNGQLFALLISGFALISILQALLMLYRNKVLQGSALRLSADIRVSVFKHISTLPLNHFSTNQVGTLSSRITQDTGEAYELTSSTLVTVLADALTLFIVLPFIFWIEWRLAGPVIVILVGYALYYRKHDVQLREDGRKHRDNWDKIVSFLHEKISAIRIIRAFGKEQYELNVFKSHVEKDQEYYWNILNRCNNLSISVHLIGSFSSLLVLSYGGWLVMSGMMDVGTMVAFSGYVGYVFVPITRFAGMNVTIQRAATSLENIFSLLDATSQITDTKNANPTNIVSGEIEFRKVDFSYQKQNDGEKEVQTLSGISFSIPPGKVTAIVGPSGAGKSTVANLLNRLYEPTCGSILVDGLDIREITLQSLRAQCVTVMQKDVIFRGSILDNLRYLAVDASLEQIVENTKLLGVHERIMSMDQAYNTLIEERGSNLSGGEQQRISLSRAIAKQPRILILDEATSALDGVSELKVLKGIRGSLPSCTIIIITHRIATVVNADLILVMKDGRLVEQGSHEKLLELDGIYARLASVDTKDE